MVVMIVMVIGVHDNRTVTVPTIVVDYNVSAVVMMTVVSRLMIDIAIADNYMMMIVGESWCNSDGSNYGSRKYSIDSH